jgi:hypothetical protein
MRVRVRASEVFERWHGKKKQHLNSFVGETQREGRECASNVQNQEENNGRLLPRLLSASRHGWLQYSYCASARPGPKASFTTEPVKERNRGIRSEKN